MNVKYFAPKTVLEMLEGNSHFKKIVEISSDFKNVEDFIKSHLNINCTTQQLEFLEEYFNSKKK